MPTHYGLNKICAFKVFLVSVLLMYLGLKLTQKHNKLELKTTFIYRIKPMLQLALAVFL